MQRGLSQEEAVQLLVNGFVKDVLQELPMEFAVEAQKLVAISLEGASGDDRRHSAPARPRGALQSVRRRGFFDTPVAFAELDGREVLAQELEAIVRARRAASEGVRASNVGGWHSDREMTEWGGAPAQTLAEAAIQVARKMTAFGDSSPEDYGWTLQMWANISGRGAYNELHIHPGSVWSAVFYIDTGDEGLPEGAAGEFYVEDPRYPVPTLHRSGLRMIGADGRPQQDRQSLKVSRGDLILFPAWLRHGVRPYQGERERITVAMNIEVINKRHLARWFGQTS
jgi:uncharacterized protein (TIGR02466 family)